MDYSINPLLKNDSDNNGSSDDEETISRTAETIGTNDSDLIRELVRRPHNPSDKYHFSYIIFYLLGMTTLLPWNFLMTAEDYWMYKFRNVTTNETDVLTPIQAGFTSDLSVASAVPNTIFLILNAFIGHKIPLGFRMIGSICFVLALFIVTTIFVEVNTDAWQDTFFMITLSSVFVMNVASAILSGGLFGIAGQFPSEYITAVVSGQALGGIFSALAEIVSLTFGASPTSTAFVYFMVGNGVLLIALLSYIIMSKTVYFKHFTQLKKSKSTELIAGSTSTEPNFRTVFSKIWMYGFSEWLVFVTTLAIYPSVTVLINSQYKGNGHIWNDIYFVPVVNYLIFNTGDYFGRILAGMFEWPKNRPRLIAFVTLLRIAFVPALLMCNTNPRHNLPVLIHSDVSLIVMMILFSLSNGYIANICLIMAPKYVHDREKEMASSMMAAFLGIGLAFGSSISLILVQIL